MPKKKTAVTKVDRVALNAMSHARGSAIKSPARSAAGRGRPTPPKPVKTPPAEYPDNHVGYRPEDAIVEESPDVLQPSRLAHRDDDRGLWLYHGDCLEVMDNHLMIKHTCSLMKRIEHDDTGFWLAKLLRLRPAKGGRHTTSGAAPHKPLLLLCLLDLAEAGNLPVSLTRTASLALRFRAYGTLVANRWPTRLDLRLPFFYLKTQEFWTAFDADHRIAVTPEHCAQIELNKEFYHAMMDREFRIKARHILVCEYFTASEQLALLEAMGLPDRRHGSSLRDNLIREIRSSAKKQGRNVKFQIGIVDGYHHTCALTGYRCFTDEGATVVDAAHIEAWSESHNDDLTNGLALSKTAHWMFDEGLWSVTDDLRIITKPSRFTETGPAEIRLKNFANLPLKFDSAATLRPSPNYLSKHRRKFGFEW